MFKSKFKATLTIGLLFKFCLLYSQGPFIFQYDNVPIVLNPALAGNDAQHHEITLNLGNHLANVLGDSSYKSGLLTFNSRLPVNKDKYIGIGLLASIDRAGLSNFGTTQLHPTLSYSTVIKKSSKSKASISLGSSFGPSKTSVDVGQLIFPDPNSPEEINSQKWYFNIALGSNINYTIYDRINLDFGISIDHLNEPNTSLSNTSNAVLKRSFKTYAVSEIKLNNSFSIIPNLLIFRHVNRGFELYGLKTRLYLHNKTINYVQAGVQYLPNNISTLVLNLESLISRFLISMSIGRTNIGPTGQSYELGIGYLLKRTKSIKEN